MGDLSFPRTNLRLAPCEAPTLCLERSSSYNSLGCQPANQWSSWLSPGPPREGILSLCPQRSRILPSLLYSFLLYKMPHPMHARCPLLWLSFLLDSLRQRISMKLQLCPGFGLMGHRLQIHTPNSHQRAPWTWRPVPMAICKEHLGLALRPISVCSPQGI